MNFQDITFLYDVKRFVRAKYIAATYKKMIKEDLHQKYKQVRRENFNEFLMEGGSLTFLELKRLDTTLKKDYMKQVMLRDEVSNMYVGWQMQQLKAANEQMGKAIKDIDKI